MIVDNFKVTKKQLRKLKQFHQQIVENEDYIVFNQSPVKISRNQYYISMSYGLDIVDVVENWKDENLYKQRNFDVLSSCPFIFIFIFLVVFVIILFLTHKLFLS